MGQYLSRSLLVAVFVAAAVLRCGPASAIVVGGGGSSRTDCLLVLDGPFNSPPDKPRHIRCTDGDPSCDADMTVNGVCAFQIAACANSTFDSRCTLNAVQSVTVDHALDDASDPKFDPDYQALQSAIASDIDPPTTDVDECTSPPTTIQVSIVGPFSGVCKKGKKKLKITTVSPFVMGKQYKDRDTIKLTCDPDPTIGCDAMQLFGGTFDRIQTQIFNQSCAVSGCHDSESQTGSLLLEEGASYTNLVDVNPMNAAALGAGWKRVDQIDMSSGDPATSFIFHKITGDLDPGFGERMPLDRPKLDSSLIDIIQLWIEAGAPQTGWVPGTD